MATKKSKRESPVLAVIDAIPDPAFLIDSNGTVLHVNSPFEKLLNLKKKEITGKQVLKASFLPKDAQQLLKKRLKKLEEGSAVKALTPHEIYLPAESDTETYVELTANSIEYDGAPADIVVLRDITEQKRLEEMLKCTEETAAPPISEDTSDIIVMLDKDAAITYCSPSTTAILGYDPEELTGKNAVELVCPDDTSKVTYIFTPGEQPLDYGTLVEFRLLHKDGSWRFFELAGKNVLDDPSVEGSVLRFRDISKFKQAKEKLRDTEDRFKAVFENANDAIVYLDTLGTIIDINHKVTDILGYRKGDAVGKNFAEIDLIPPENMKNVLKLYDEAISGNPSQFSELKVNRKDGITISVGVSTGTIGQKGKTEGLFVIVRDITKRKEAESRIEHLNAILRAIRNVNQLIIREKDRAQLIQKVCDTLIETRGYNAAWIVLPNEFGEVMISGQAGNDETFPLLIEEMNQGHWPQCAQIALAQTGTTIINDANIYCSKCPILKDCVEHLALAIRLERDGKVFGVFCVSLFDEDTIGKEEQDLFEETAGDIAFALHSIDISEEHEQAENKIRVQNEEIQSQFYELEQANIDLKQAQRKLLNTNQMLRESEEKYRSLIENTGVPIAYFARNGRILTINTNAAEILNGVPSDFIGKSIYDLFPDIADEFMLRMRKVIESDTSQESDEFYEMFSRNYWFATSMYPVKDASGRTFAIQVIARDITEQKQTEETLHETELKLRLIFDTIKDGITISDLEGNIIDANQTGLERHGFKHIDELRGMKGVDFIVERDRERAINDMEQALSNESPLTLVEYTLHSHTGEEMLVEASASLLKDSEGNTTAFISVTRDITERRKAEEALRKSESRFRSLLEKSSDGIAIIESDGSFGYRGPVNDLILGYDEEGAAFKSIFDLIHPDDQSRLASDFAGLMEKPGSLITENYRTLHKDGSWRTLEVVGRNLTDDPTVKGIVVNFRDVTERKQAEEAVKASEQKFREIFDNVNDEIMYLDSGGNIIDVNDKVKDIFGYEPEEIIGRPYTEFEIAFGEDKEKIYRMFSKVIASGETKLVEIKGRRKDGSTVYAEVSPSIIESDSGPEGMLIVVRDITERKEAEELFTTLATNSQIGSYIIQDGVFRFVNPVFLRDLELTESDVLGKPPKNIVHPDDLERVYQEAIKMLKGEKTAGYEFRVIDKNGNIRHAYEKVTGVEYQGKRASLGSYMDITEHKQAEEKLNQYREELEQNLDELQNAYEQLKEMDKLKDNFLSTVSHELRTPLTSIKSFTEILLTYEDDRETQREFLTIINDESDRLTRLINDFLDLSKIEAGQMQWETALIDVSQIIETAVATTEALAASAGLTVNIESEPGLPLVWGDKDRFVQVITNLLSNSIKFTPEEGFVTIKSKLVKGDKSNNEPDIIKVSVTDTGVGLTPEDQKLIFERFVQVSDSAKTKPGGTGLGLPICKEIVEHYGGTIWVESEPDKNEGSTFAFTVPVPQELNTAATTVVDTQPENIPKVGDTILVVDDEVNIRRFLSHELSMKGYHTMEASNGKEAIAMVKEHLPDLITLDVILPDISGFEVAEKLRNDPVTRHIPILIISVLEDKEGVHRIGATDYVSKPFSGETILEKISGLLRNPRGTILVVDDDKALVEAITYELQQKGFSTSVAHDGEAALKIVQSNPPDLIILDVMMPKMDGHDVIKELKCQPETAEIPIIVLTGVDLSENQVTTLSMQSNELLTKSGGLTRLFESAANILARRPAE